MLKYSQLDTREMAIVDPCNFGLVSESEHPQCANEAYFLLSMIDAERSSRVDQY
jgi:hypothetical protein